MNRVHRILIAEDDEALARGLAQALRADDRAIVCCGSKGEAKEQLKKGGIDLVLLDVNLPDGSGLELLADLRRRSDIPVILLTANDLETDIVGGLELGANDYITKPFSLAILRARVQAQLRGSSTRNEIYADAVYRFDFTGQRYFLRGEPVELSKTEQRLLRLLVENGGMTVPRETLLDRVWPDGAQYVEENALSVTVKRLRDKLDAKERIRTVYGRGYTWEKEA